MDYAIYIRPVAAFLLGSVLLHATLVRFPPIFRRGRRWCVHDGGRIMYYYDSKSEAIRRKNGTAIVLRNGVLRVGRCES